MDELVTGLVESLYGAALDRARFVARERFGI
jgi:hypothetical protein